MAFAFGGYKQTQRLALGGRQLQAEAFMTAARRLDVFHDGGRQGTAYVRALRFTHSLWSIVRADLSRPGNGAPKALKQQVLSLSLFVEREIARAVVDPAEARIAAMVEVNRNIAAGLYSPVSPD